jgi:hypothetical protein
VDFVELSVGSFTDPDGPTIGCAPIAYFSVLEQWIGSPYYGISEISEAEIAVVKEAIVMVNEVR